MTEACDGRQVVGMDLHRQRSVLVRMTADGRRLETARIANSAPELRRVISRAGEHRRRCSRPRTAGTGPRTRWRPPARRCTWRTRRGSERSAADGSRTIRRTPPTWRTCCGWAGWPRRGFAPPQTRQLRELTRYRIKLVRLRSSAKDQVHAVLAKHGIPVPCPGPVRRLRAGVAGGLRLPQPHAGKAGSLRQLVGWLSGEISLLDEVIADFLGGYQPYQAVRALPGLGPVPAAVAVAEIGDISRFPGPGQLCSWAGLTPRHRESDLKVARGHITKQGSPVLRRAMTEAIQHQPAASPPRELRDAVIARRGAEARNIAKAAAARKLLTCVFYAMRDGEVRSVTAAARTLQTG